MESPAKPPGAKDTKDTAAPKPAGCYDGVDDFLNRYGGANSWWRCIRRDAEQLYAWDDPIHKGKAVLLMNGPEMSRLVAKRVSRPVFADFYAVIEWEKSLLTLYAYDTKGADDSRWEIVIPPEWLPALKACRYPHNASPF